jgi:hypothetical protein
MLLQSVPGINAVRCTKSNATIPIFQTPKKIKASHKTRKNLCLNEHTRTYTCIYTPCNPFLQGYGTACCPKQVLLLQASDPTKELRYNYQRASAENIVNECDIHRSDTHLFRCVSP